MAPKHRGAAALALLLAAVSVTSCTGGGQLAREGKPAVAIGIDATDPEQVVLAEIYNRVLTAQGRPVSVTALGGFEGSDDSLGMLKLTQVDFVITCSGTLLRAQNPAAARELAGESEAQRTEADAPYTDRVYAAAAAALPGDVQTVDPSPAQGCAAKKGEKGEKASAGEGLAQNIIPLFQKGMLDRGEVQRVNAMTRMMATDDVAEMVEEYEDGTPLPDVVRDWLLEYAQIDVYAGEQVDPVDPDSATSH